MKEGATKSKDGRKLTSREEEILAWVGEGKTNWEISQIAECGLPTVKTHLYRIYPKIGVENRVGAANYWQEQKKRRRRRKKES